MRRAAAKWMGGGAASLAALGLVLSPVLAATTSSKARSQRSSLSGLGSMVSFTPAVADPRLAAAFARRGIPRADFQFTPSASTGSKRPIKVAIRARAVTPAAAASAVARRGAAPRSAEVAALSPTSYNLGVAVGWKGFAVTGDVAKVDTGVQPGGRESAEVGVNYNLKRFTGRVQAGADRPDERQPRLVDNSINYSVDVRGSYAVTKNIEVTGGVRYRIERDRLAPLTDDRRDSQAVYVGTAFRF